jgi:replicative DNA helicase Mcm
MSGRWDEKENDLERKYDEQHGHNHGDDNGPDDNNNGGWTPRHHDTIPPEHNNRKIHSVSEASRLHEGKGIHVIGVISGIQPLRKMIKGMSVQCMKCNTIYERRYDKPELFESYVPIEHISKCQQCKSRDYLGRPKHENINAVIVELKDHNTFSEIDPLRIIVFGDDEPAYDDTINIDRHIGETIIVRGDIFTVDISRRHSESKMVAYLYVSGLVNYLLRQEIDLSNEDVKAIKRFVERVGQDNIVDKLSSMFATSIIGNNYVKRGLLLCAASTTTDKTAKKIQAILVGDPGLAKSRLLKESTKLVPNSRYESVQFATGKSLTAIVTKEEGDALILRIGPIPQAKGAIAALNEIGRMIQEDQGYMLDTMQEQEFTTNKFGQNFHVDSPTVIIGSANPQGGSWKFSYEDEKIDIDKIPMIKPLVDRFDLIFAFKDNRDESILADYASKKSEMEDRPSPDYTAYLAKHIMYAKLRYPKPKFSYEAKDMLNQFYVSIRIRYGSPRIMETIYRIAQNIARLKLKNIVDEADAKETVQFYNFILQQLNMVVASPSNPRDAVYEECLGILMKSRFAISFEELVKSACERNKQVERYIGSSFKLEENKKLRLILDMLRNHSRIREVKMKPVVLEYIHAASAQAAASDTNESMVKAGKQAFDLYDPYDLPDDTAAKKLEPENIAEVSDPRSDRSDRSDSVHNDTPEYTPGEDGNGSLFKCYHPGCDFLTDDVGEYEKHGALNHYPNTLLYPSNAECEKYGLKRQGKPWER